MKRKLIKLLTYGVKHREHSKVEAHLRVDCRVLPNIFVAGSENGTFEHVHRTFARCIADNRRLAGWFETIAVGIRAVATAHPPHLPLVKIAFFCIGGRHRSVSVAELVKQKIESDQVKVEVQHLELEGRVIKQWI